MIRKIHDMYSPHIMKKNKLESYGREWLLNPHDASPLLVC